MKRQRSYGDGLDWGAEKSGCKEWGKKDQDGNKMRSLKNLDSESSERLSYRRSYSSKLEGGRGEDRDDRVEWTSFSPEAYRRKEHLDYRTERKGFGRLDSPRKPFRDSIGEWGHRSSSNGSPSPSSSSSYRRDLYDPPPKVKGFRSKRDDSTWRRSSSKERAGGDVVTHSLPRVGSWFSRVVGMESEDRGSGASGSAVESRQLENGENCSSEMEEGELEPELEVDAGAIESPASKESEIREVETTQEKESAPGVSKEEDVEATGGGELESFVGENKSELNVTAAVMEDHESNDAVAEKPLGDKMLVRGNGSGNELDGCVNSVDGETNEELLMKEHVSFPSRDNEHLSKTSYEEAGGLSQRMDGNANLLQDLNEKTDDAGFQLDEKPIKDDQGHGENDSDCKPSVTFMLEKYGIGLPAEAGKLVEEVGRSLGTTQKAVARENTESHKEKGKRVVIENEEDLAAYDGLVERDLLISADHHETHLGDNNASSDVKEGTRRTGLELFSETRFGNKLDKLLDGSVEKHKSNTLKSEQLHLSLGLPDVSLTLASPNLKAAPAPPSPSQARSAHSMPTNSFCTRASSDGFTASISYSGSQPFVHNPSCSLTQNSLDNYEHSVGSHPIFHGVDQFPQGSGQGQSLSEQMHSGNNNGVTERNRQLKEIPLYQRLLQNSNGVFQPLSYQEPSAFHVVKGNANFQDKVAALRGQRHMKAEEGSMEKCNGLERWMPFERERAELRRLEVAPSPTQSEGSHETKLKQNKRVDNDHNRPESNHPVLHRGGQSKTQHLALNEIKSTEKLISDIVSEPVPIMARRLEEIPEQPLLYLKEKVRELIVNGSMQKHLSVLQEVLQKRTDLTMETLLKCHRVQLEIFVSVKTGLQAFLRQINHVSSSDLVEIFLNFKCRNLACQSILPVDDCDCKICNQKNGFCNACMCLVCSKFDLASNTCSWVGCDLCLHWCHTDCGLRDSHVRNGQSVNGAAGTTDMQFHCVACGHPSEMFGFVKEVFKTCSKDWNAETLSKELEYVRRIFHGSFDVRGKQLHDVADQMLVHLENRGNVLDAYDIIMAFLAEGDTDVGGLSSALVTKGHQSKYQEPTNGITSLSKGFSFKASSVSGEMVSRPEVMTKVLLNADMEQRGKYVDDSEFQLITGKKPAVDEFECIIRIKQAEAKMFQTRADDARREAEGLKRIAVTKSEKIEEEYTSRIGKLHLADAEHRRQQKVEELQALERAHHDYFNMKMRMEADIKDLLLKMETTKQKLNT